MGAKLKYGGLSQSVQHLPGPGHYEGSANSVKIKAPQFGFGSSKRPDIVGGKKDTTPGPGDYKIPVRISNLEDFEIPGHHHEFRHV